MTNPRNLICMSCNNRYSSRHSTCPECTTELISVPPEQGITQTTSGQGSQSTINTGIIDGDVTNTTNIVTGRELAEYDTKQLGSYPSFWNLISSKVKIAGGATVIGVFTWISGSASILSYVGLTPDIIPPPIKFLIGALAVGAIAACAKQIFDLADIKFSKWLRLKSNLYVRNEDNSITHYFVSGKCPVLGCPGELYLGCPRDNFEGVGFCGMCSKHSYLHAFEFNDETYIGPRVVITPIPKNSDSSKPARA